MLSAIDTTVSPKHRHRKLSELKYIVIHRTIGETVEECVAEFRNTEQYQAGWYTGGLFPYHFALTYSEAAQCLPLKIIGPAALSKLNLGGIHIALTGDFRKRPPNPGQLIRLKHLCTSLMNSFNGSLSIMGHTEDNGFGLKTSSDPNKSCPGKYLNLDDVRAYVNMNKSNVCHLSPEDALRRANIVI